jgi:hypothetical protein
MKQHNSSQSAAQQACYCCPFQTDLPQLASSWQQPVSLPQCSPRLEPPQPLQRLTWQTQLETAAPLRTPVLLAAVDAAAAAATAATATATATAAAHNTTAAMIAAAAADVTASTGPVCVWHEGDLSTCTAQLQQRLEGGGQGPWLLAAAQATGCCLCPGTGAQVAVQQD